MIARGQQRATVCRPDTCVAGSECIVHGGDGKMVEGEIRVVRCGGSKINTRPPIITVDSR